jgi:two-component system CheB/CheR fusion protein
VGFFSRLLDLNGVLTLANERARVLFGLNPQDIGRPLQDLELSYRPVELRSPIEQAYAERQVIKLPSVERHLPAGVQYLDVQVTPLQDPPGGGHGASVLGASVTFDDVTQRQRVRDELLRSSQELETAYEELQSSNEELETTGEELQSTNEELETTNEELQSTNEELETMNEELRSTNEELEALNEELRQRTDDLNHANAFLRSILTSLHSGVVVVDCQLDVLVWNHRAEDLWGLRADEVQGHSLLTLDIGLPVEQLPISAFLSGKADHESITVNATNRRGRAVRCHITCTPFLGAEGEREGVILVMEEVET